jgi:hypothetical protein
VRQHADHDLDGHEGEDQPERDSEAPRVMRAAVRMPMRMPVCVAVHRLIMHVCTIMVA